jgi:hypothetical protein
MVRRHDRALKVSLLEIQLGEVVAAGVLIFDQRKVALLIT